MSKYVKWLLLIFMATGYALLPGNDALAQARASSANNSTYVTGVTPGRARSLIGGVAGLVSVVLGWRANNRSAAGKSNVRILGLTAWLFGLAGLILAIMHLISATGAVFGSGSGKAGAIVGIVLCLVGITLAAVASKKSIQNEK